MTKKYFDLATAEPVDRYKLLSGLVVPRPIGWIGTRRENGTYNLAPFSFFNVVSSNPPMVIFSAGSHADRPKDSSTLAEISGEFTVNIVSEDVAFAMSETSRDYGEDQDEFTHVGLTPVPGTIVSAPLVAESPANLECRVDRILELGAEGRTRLVFGEVVAIHAQEEVLDGTRVNNDVLKAIGRMAGNTYTATSNRFEIERPG